MTGVMMACLRAATVMLLSLLALGAYAAEQYPVRPLRLIVPFGPGGVGDLTARAVAQKMGESLGQQVIIDNRPSAGGVVAAEMVAKAEPDGHTLLLLNNQQAVSVSLFKSLPYDPLRDFSPISTIGSFSLAVLATTNSPYKSLKELIAQARATPGKLNGGTINVGATQNLAAELFKSMANINVVIVPYNSTGAVLTALRGGDVQFAVEILAPIVGQVKAGNLRALGVTTSTRFSMLPDVPTVSESGVSGYEVTSWNGIAAPAKTPRALVNRLHQVVTAALATAEVKQRFQDLAVEPRPSTPEAFRTHLQAEIAKWKKVIEEAKIPRQ
jgi:tripartite-type tricarboxylate transporter receptor subunit TctC